MVDIAELEVGDRVRIVDAWNEGCNVVGITPNMNRFLGQIVTVTRTLFREDDDRHVIRIHEDNGGFVWNRWMISKIIEMKNCPEDINEDDFYAVLNG